jgi:alpha-L-rhamnosidase
LFGGIGGIRPASPGYHTILIAPVVRQGLTWAQTSYDSIHGKIATSWKVDANQLTLDVTVPVNTIATVCVPVTGDPATVKEGGKSIQEAKGIKFLRTEKGTVVLEVESGTYRFASTYDPGSRENLN